MWKFAIILAVATTSLAAGQTVLDECGICRKEECPPSTDCRAGLVLDKCGCCSVCGRIEGEKCDNYTLPLPYKDLYGFCGDNMACLLRNDLEDLVRIFFCFENYKDIIDRISCYCPPRLSQVEIKFWNCYSSFSFMQLLRIIYGQGRTLVPIAYRHIPNPLDDDSYIAVVKYSNVRFLLGENVFIDKMR